MALGRAVEEAPPPAVLAAHRGAWSAEAQKWGGTFRAADFSIREASYLGASVDLLTRFDEAGTPQVTVARVRLGRPAKPGPLSAEARRIFTSLSAECEGLRISAEAVEATLPTPLSEPTRAESLWRGLMRLAEVL